MAVTLTGQDDVVFTFAEEELGDIDVDISGSPDSFGTYGNGPMGTYLFDSNGVTATITINGRIIATATTRTSSGTTTSVAQQIAWLAKQLNGQQTPKGFSSDFASQFWASSGLSNTTVMSSRFRYKQQEFSPDAVPFTLVLLVGVS